MCGSEKNVLHILFHICDVGDSSFKESSKLWKIVENLNGLLKMTKK